MFHRRRIVEQALILALTLSFEYVQGQDAVELDREIHGTLMTTRKGNNISAYLGIPYAEPPIGPLRFKNPILWGRKDRHPIIAKTDAKQCPQINNDGVIVGDEDCLYLNVYTPKSYLDGLYPVMVYFHGGNFVRGSGSSKDAGPEYLLDMEIILVTVNYRLGVLGFLSTGDAAAPGNFGLKDQALALEWVRMNILYFGGNPDHVTIFGQDAGGVSTILHALSPGSKDLFERFISQSGNPLAFWAFAENDYKKYATYLGDYLKCPTTDESFQLVECLRHFDPYTLVASDHIFNDNHIWRYRTWAPTVEPAGLAGTFITDYPISLMLQINGIKNCPSIIGNVVDEGLVLTAEFNANSTIYDSISGDLYAFINYFIKTYIDTVNPDNTSKIVEDFYFNGGNITSKETTIRNMTDFITDIGFEEPTTRLSNTMILENPMLQKIYMYRFNYRGTYSKSSDAIGNNDNIGVCHGDDLIYLFPIKNSTLQLSDSDEKMIDIMVDLWTSFANNGTPTSQYMSDPNIWKPYEISTDTKYLQIGKESDPLEIKQYNRYNERVSFWYVLIQSQFLQYFFYI